MMALLADKIIVKYKTKYKNFSYLLLSLILLMNSVVANVCDDHMSPAITYDESIVLLEDYNKVFTQLPKELQLAVTEGLLRQEQLTNYLNLQAKWDKRGAVAANFFKNSGLWRKSVENPKFLYDYASNVCSGAATTVICHIPYMKANAVYDTPLLTVDLLAGFITDSELSYVAAKNPSYLRELKKRGLIKPSKIEEANQKFNSIVDKVKEISFRNYLKRRKKVEIDAEAAVEATLSKSKIPAKYLPEVKRHLKEMSKLSVYFTLAGAVNGVAYHGLQNMMAKWGFNLDDPYAGFSMWTEASYFAQFSVHAYGRIILTDKIVGKTRSMVDDVFEGLKQGYLENPGGMIDPNRIAMYDTMKYFFLGATTIGIYFASNYWATDVFIRWREEGFDNSILIFPYQKEMNQVMEQMEATLLKVEKEAKQIEFEIEQELSKMDDYRWWASH